MSLISKLIQQFHKTNPGCEFHDNKANISLDITFINYKDFVGIVCLILKTMLRSKLIIHSLLRYTNNVIIKTLLLKGLEISYF